jgi:hypothetical protein
MFVTILLHSVFSLRLYVHESVVSCIDIFIMRIQLCFGEVSGFFVVIHFLGKNLHLC